MNRKKAIFAVLIVVTMIYPLIFTMLCYLRQTAPLDLQPFHATIYGQTAYVLGMVLIMAWITYTGWRRKNGNESVYAELTSLEDVCCLGLNGAHREKKGWELYVIKTVL